MIKNFYIKSDLRCLFKSRGLNFFKYVILMFDLLLRERKIKSKIRL